MDSVTVPGTTFAIICTHCAEMEYPILRAERNRQLEEEDSGWQFLCNRWEPETVDTARVWLLQEVAELDPTLLPFLDSPVGTILERPSPAAPWKKVSLLRRLKDRVIERIVRVAKAVL